MKQKRLSRKIRKSYTIQTNIDELAEVLAKLLYELKIDQIHIMTYKDRIDIFATMTHLIKQDIDIINVK